jgi:hypothetical protein
LSGGKIVFCTARNEYDTFIEVISVGRINEKNEMKNGEKVYLRLKK